jgi:hypothetical protein
MGLVFLITGVLVFGIGTGISAFTLTTGATGKRRRQQSKRRGKRLVPPRRPLTTPPFPRQ